MFYCKEFSPNITDILAKLDTCCDYVNSRSIPRLRTSYPEPEPEEDECGEEAGETSQAHSGRRATNTHTDVTELTLTR